MKENLNIELFHQLLNSNETEGSLLDALRSLAQLESKDSVKGSEPQLGAWSGWTA